MMNPESFADAVNRGMAEVRRSMQETAEWLEAELRRVTVSAGYEDSAAKERRPAGDAQFWEMVDSWRDEAARAAGQFSDGMNEMMGEFRHLLEVAGLAWGESEPGASGPVEARAARAVSAEQVGKAAAKKSAGKAR